MIGPHPLDNDDAALQPVKGAGMDDDAALAVADAQPVAVGEAETGECCGVEEGSRAALAGDARRGVVKARVQKRARRCGDKAERPFGIAVVGDRDMIGKRGQPRVVMAERRPVGAEMEFLVGVAKAVEKMRGLERRAAIEPAIGRKFGDAGQPARAQGAVDQFERRHPEARMTCAEATGKRADHIVVRAAFAIGRQDRAAQLQIGVSAGGVEIVVFEKRRGRQNDVRHRRGFGQELLVDADEQIVAGKTPAHEPRFRCDDHRVGVLDKERCDRRPVAEVATVARQDRPDARLVEDAGRRVEQVEPFEQGVVERHQTMVRL